MKLNQSNHHAMLKLYQKRDCPNAYISTSIPTCAHTGSIAIGSLAMFSSVEKYFPRHWQLATKQTLVNIIKWNSNNCLLDSRIVIFHAG